MSTGLMVLMVLLKTVSDLGMSTGLVLLTVQLKTVSDLGMSTGLVSRSSSCGLNYRIISKVINSIDVYS